MHIKPGQRNDTPQASQLLEGFEKANIIEDKADDSNALIEQIHHQNCIPVIPSRSHHKNPRRYDEDLYHERHLVGYLFNKIKPFIRVFARFDKKFSSVVLAFASLILCLK